MKKTINNLFLSPELIANKFGITYKDLSRLIYPSQERSYRSFVIPKKNGSERLINTPKPELKAIQRNLVDELYNYLTPRKSCHGFIKGRSIVSNAKKHVGKRYVFNIDLDDFFGTIHFGRVKNLFLKDPFYYSHQSATVIAQICCYKGCLPQGAPTSPLISNLICWKMDAQLQNLAYKNNCDYTRYADDITFSFTSSKRKLPRSIVCFDEEGAAIPGQALKRIIEENGFSINREKVRLRGKGSCQEVTGIKVNEFLNVDRSFIRKTSSMIHALEKYGAASAEKVYLEKYREKPLLARQKRATSKSDGEFLIDVIKGRVNYIQMIRGRGDQIYRKLAYRLTRALGVENKEFLRTTNDLIRDSTFIIYNHLSDTQGSGFLLEGYGVVTNEHVVEGIDTENDDYIEFFRDYEVEKKRKGKYLASSKKNDIAIFSGDKEFNDISALKIADESKYNIGDTVTVVGYPDYSEGETAYFNKGKIIQEAIRFGVKFFLIDIPVIHGNSGGPVLNNNLEVIGIASRGTASHDMSSKFNGFIPISYIKELKDGEN